MKQSNDRVQQPVELISIGELASKTGLSPERLRSWEQRYGRPEPVRLESGHRRYPASEVSFLMDVGRLLVHGFKASELLKSSPEELRERVKRSMEQPFEELDYWRSLVERFDAKVLKGVMHEMAASMTLVEFLDSRIAPFLWDLGERWANGELRISHEHFATFRVGEVIGELTPKDRAFKEGVKVLLATLPGDLHGLGVAMAEAVLATEGVEAVVLGADNPVQEIAGTARTIEATHIALSISRGLAQRGVGKLLEELIESAPDQELVLGGGGMSMGLRLPKSVKQFRTMTEFQRWLKRM
ncbi:MAG: MerR family DNA-binding transcriptional regulator [Planctomycetes bacterium]|nr:MerR family DNA-binding transcriptional regulator [Planctomycetota bacterium]